MLGPATREPEFIFHKNQKFAIRRLKREMERKGESEYASGSGSFLSELHRGAEMNVLMRGGFIMIKLHIIFMTLDLGQGRGG
jgi:hypothetical protein